MKKPRVRDHDQFLVRLPDGMRERIKAKADRAGMSMNEAIVWCLEDHFPAAVTLEQKIDELVEMTAILENGASDPKTFAAVERLTEAFHKTLSQISDGKVSSEPNFKASVKERLLEWEERKAEDWRETHVSPFPDDYNDDPEPF